MASNGLVTNAEKTSMIIINKRRAAGQLVVQIGNAEVKEDSSCKLLGLTIGNNMTWSLHMEGLLNQLKSRSALLAKLMAYVPRKALIPVAHGIIVSKVRFGLSVFSSPRLNAAETPNLIQKKLQTAVNNVMRLLAGRKKNR